MAKQAKSDPRTFFVRVNGGHPGPWTIEATSAEEAITLVIEKNKLQRDRRNFQAAPVDEPGGQPPRVPTFPVQPPAAGK